MNSKKAFSSLRTLPIRPFKSRLSHRREVEDITLEIYAGQPDSKFFVKGERVHKLNKKLRSIIERCKGDAISGGLVGITFKNYLLKENCFIILKNKLIQPGLWINYPNSELNLDSYDTCLNTEVIENSSVNPKLHS